MAEYAIGDVHACLPELQALLTAIRFDPANDRVWFTGDLVGRGPQPAETLRFIRGLGERAEAVLGNHDIHCLAVAEGTGRQRKDDNLAPLLKAEDRATLIDWLRQRPLLCDISAGAHTLVHAGIPPQWDLEDARRLAREAEALLRGPDCPQLLAHLYGNDPDRWQEDLTGWDRARFIINAFTRMRYCRADGRLRFQHNGPPEAAPADHYPWYEAPGQHLADSGRTVIAGHWSRLGQRSGPGYVTLDTGCLWGGALTALRLDGPKPVFTQVACPGNLRPA